MNPFPFLLWCGLVAASSGIAPRAEGAENVHAYRAAATVLLESVRVEVMLKLGVNIGNRVRRKN